MQSSMMLQHAVPHKTCGTIEDEDALTGMAGGQETWHPFDTARSAIARWRDGLD